MRIKHRPIYQLFALLLLAPLTLAADAAIERPAGILAALAVLAAAFVMLHWGSKEVERA